MLWIALGGAGLVQRMVRTNHSQNLFPCSQQIPSEVLKQYTKGIQTGDLGASPLLLSPDKPQRKLENCVGDWRSRRRPTRTFLLQPSAI